MRQQITEDVKSAMRAGDKRRLTTLRLIQAAIKDRDIAARVDENGQSTGQEQINDTQLLQLLEQMIKQRRQSIKMYIEGGRTELSDQEQAEIEIIQEYLPKQMTDAEVSDAISAIISELGAKGLKDMGRTMSALKERYAGQMDIGKASGMVKAKLT